MKLSVDISSFLYCCRHWALLKGAVTFISKVRLSWLCLDHKPKHIFHIFSKRNLIWYQKTCQTSDQKPNWPFIEKWRMREGIRKLVHFFSFIDFYCLCQMKCKETVQNPWQGRVNGKYWNKTMFAPCMDGTIELHPPTTISPLKTNTCDIDSPTNIWGPF